MLVRTVTGEVGQVIRETATTYVVAVEGTQGEHWPKDWTDKIDEPTNEEHAYALALAYDPRRIVQ